MIEHVKSQQGIARTKLLVILLAITVVVVAGVAIFARSQGSQQGTADNPAGYRVTSDRFIKLLTQNNADASFNLMTEAGKKDVGGIDKWRETVKGSFAEAKAAAAFSSEHDIEDPGGVYTDKRPKLMTYRLEMFNATWETSLTVVKDGATWKVDRIGTELTQ